MKFFEVFEFLDEAEEFSWLGRYAFDDETGDFVVDVRGQALDLMIC